MRYLSVCSGIEAATRAWRPLGWRAVAFAEIDPFASALLASHYPNVPNLGDITQHERWKDIPAFDILVGGTPCQSFSVAGLRRGLEDPRGSLMLTYLGILDRFRPRWCVWENVPGVLSSSGGRDFGAFLGALGELGYGFAYRVLDAQYVRVESHPRAVPQRRRRVFVVGHLGNWRRAAEVLLEPEGVRGDSAPRREAGKGFARGVGSGPARGGQPQWVAEAISFKAGQSEAAGAFFATNGFAPTLQSANNGSTAVPAVAFKPSHYTRGKDGAPSEVFPPLSADADKGDQDAVVLAGYAVTAGHQSSPSEKDFIYVNDIGVSVPLDQMGADPTRRQGGTLVLGPASDGIPEVCGAITDGAHHGGELNGQDAYSGRIIPQPVVYDRQQITSPTNRCNPQPGDPSFPLHTSGAPLLVAPDWPAEVAPTMDASWADRAPHTMNQEFISKRGAMFVPEPLTLEVRGREGGRDIEIVPSIPMTVPIDLRQTARGEKDTNNRHESSGGSPGTGIANDGDPAFTVSERGQAVAHALTTNRRGAKEDGTGRGSPLVAEEVAASRVGMAVRRLTPRECERLQGFPDDYTLIEYRGKPAADGNRYKALGNSMAVNVMRFIGERIALVEARASGAHDGESDG